MVNAESTSGAGLPLLHRLSRVAAEVSTTRLS
jgi:hypothetical protein